MTGVFIYTRIYYFRHQHMSTQHHIDEKTLRAIFNDAIDAMIIISERGIIEQVNPSVSKLFGYAFEEMSGQNISMLMPEPYRSQHDGYMKHHRDTGERKIIGIGREVSGKRKDGSVFPVFLSVSEVFLPDGRRVFAGVMRDITDLKEAQEKAKQYTLELERMVEERTHEIRGVVRALELTNRSLENQYKETKRAEQELIKNQLLLSIIAKNYPNGVICIFNQDMICEFMEGNELSKLGLASSDFVGKRMTETPAGHETAAIHEAHFAKTLQGEETTYEIVYGNFNYLFNTTPIIDEQGIINRVVAVGLNITPMKDAEAQVKDALEKANQLNEMKSRFISMASHEFRTPLSTILSSLNLMLRYHEMNQGEKLTAHAKKIKASIANLTEILEYFLSVEKLESGKVKLEPSTFNVVTFTSEFVGEMQDMVDDNLSIHFSNRLANEEIHTDKKIFRTILQNLLSNAVKYSPDGGTVNVTLEGNQQGLKLTIADEGMGIPEKDQPFLFDRFYRAENASNIQGTGLGLNIIKKYIELLGGDITFQSKIGTGTTFIVHIPLNHQDYETNTHY